MVFFFEEKCFDRVFFRKFVVFFEESIFFLAKKIIKWENQIGEFTHFKFVEGFVTYLLMRMHVIVAMALPR